MKKHDIKSLTAVVAVALVGLLMARGAKASLVSDSPSATCFNGLSVPVAGSTVYGFGRAQAGSLHYGQGSSDVGILTSSFSPLSSFSAIGNNSGSEICSGSARSLYGRSDNAGQVSPVPETSTMIAGVLLLLPFGVSMVRILCCNKSHSAVGLKD